MSGGHLCSNFPDRPDFLLIRIGKSKNIVYNKQNVQCNPEKMFFVKHAASYKSKIMRKVVFLFLLLKSFSKFKFFYRQIYIEINLADYYF